MRADYYFQRKLDKLKQKSLLHRLLLWSLLALFACTLLGILSAVALFVYFSYDLPSINEIKKVNLPESTIIFDRDENPLYSVHGEENREIIPLKEISPNMIKATLAVEDKNFYAHYGFNWKRIIKAFYNNLTNKLTGKKLPTQGASTITQQLVKNTFLTPEKTMTRKIKELILSIKVESALSKDQILEMYLNKISYGNNAYGIKRAAEIYFGVEPKDLTIGQSAVLASLPQAPSRYSPFGPHRYSYLLKEFTEDEVESRQITEEKNLNINEFSRGLIGKVNMLDSNHNVYIRGRSDIVLRLMEDLNLITLEEKTEAWEQNQKIEFSKYREVPKSPHFVLYVKQLLEDKYGKDLIEKGGLRVYTTLDPHLQEVAEKLITDQVKINAVQTGATNAALLSIQAQTGQILAMVGSADYYDEKINGNVNLVLRPRQPGSSFKPIVYAKGFLNRISPASIVYDVETKFDGGDPPKNFDGRFEGPITFRRALGFSRNIPAIKMYFLAGGQKVIVPFAQEMGVESLDSSFDYGWPLALGSGDIPMIEMVQAYSVFANNGLKKEITPFLKIENSSGKILEKWEPDKKDNQVLDPQVAFLINDILSDKEINVGRMTRIEGQTVAAKTGTSTKRINDKVVPSNGWLFGYTTKIVTGVWAGNADGSALKMNFAGYSEVAPIWQKFMIEAIGDTPTEEFPMPAGIKKITVSRASGKLPSDLTPKAFLNTDYFASFAYPVEIETCFKEASIDTISKKLATPYTPSYLVKKGLFRIHHDIDPTQTRWEDAVQRWAFGNPEIANPLPVEYDDQHSAETAKATPTVQIVTPSSFDNIGTGFTPVKIKTDAPHGVDRVEYYFDGVLQYTAKDSPYHGSVRSFGTAAGSQHVIEVKIFDALQYFSSTKITITVGQATAPNLLPIPPEPIPASEPESPSAPETSPLPPTPPTPETTETPAPIINEPTTN